MEVGEEVGGTKKLFSTHVFSLLRFYQIRISMLLTVCLKLAEDVEQVGVFFCRDVLQSAT